VYLCPKWYQRQLCQLEMLESERYSDDRNAKQQSANRVSNAQLDSADQYPDYIPERAHNTETTGRYFASERPKYKTCDLHALHSERYPDYRNAQQQAYNRP